MNAGIVNLFFDLILIIITIKEIIKENALYGIVITCDAPIWLLVNGISNEIKKVTQ